MTRSTRRFTALVATLLVAALTLGGCGFSVYDLPLPGGADTGKNAMTLKVQFADVLDLVPQSTVKLDDVTVGKVTKVQLEHGVAVVTLKVRKDTDLPANTRAEIQQTSLLGEKYVDLVRPTDAVTTALKSGATIPLRNTGRNPEIEEVLGALSLILNGGGVAQLKTISTELNKALGGREDAARSVLDQVDTLMKNLDDNKGKIVDALESINQLSKSVRGQEKTIDATLDELPAAISSIDKQRQDLVTMLKALDKLGKTGVRVIKASKDNTVAVVRDLQPVLTNLANTGDDFVNSLNTLLTYPFVDAAVGTTPQAARNTHYGDYVNLDVTLQVNLQALQNLPDLPDTACKTLKELGGKLSLDQLLELNPDILCNSKTSKSLSACQSDLEKNLAHQPNPIVGIPVSCQKLPTSLVGDLADELSQIVNNPTKAVCQLIKVLCAGQSSSKGGSKSGSKGSGSGSGSGLGNLTCDLPLVGSCRAPFASTGSTGSSTVTVGQLGTVLDPGLVSLLMPAYETGSPTGTGSGTGSSTGSSTKGGRE